MTADLPGLKRWGPPLALALLAMVAMGASLRNGWVQDDPALIRGNVAIHDASGLWTGFVQPYWPPPSRGGLYRPLARSTATAQWIAGGGSLILFRVMDLALYVGLVLAVYALARELLGPRQAWVAAALFAVHPVHVEAVAAAVNQGELVVGIAAALLALAWLRFARGAATLPRTMAFGVAALLVALGFKEHALVLPLLLGALELTVLRDVAAGRRARWAAIGGLLLVGAAWWGLRAAVLGSLAGADPVEGLRGLSFGARALTMLGVAGEWVRLLVWPARMQGDYSPWEIAPWGGWASEQTAGVAALAAFGLALALAWRHRPAVAFALLWVMLAIAPTANLVVPTGILLAERTLLLASMGAVLVAAAMVPEALWDDARWRRPLGIALGALLLLGVVRSATRMRVWRDRDSYVAALGRDAPESWRSMVALGIAAMERGDRADGERRFEAASAAWPDAPRPYQMRAFYLRLDGRCAPAVPLMKRALRLRPDDRWTRLPLVACLLDLGRYDEARAVAAADTAADTNGRALANAMWTAEDALRRNAPAHTVRLAPVTGGLTIIGPVQR